MKFNKRFVLLNWITLIFIYLVIIAGSFVRITGSGMGCPDWPRCFNQWVPPTQKDQLPDNYQDIYSEKRAKKIEKFANILNEIGLENTASQLRNDKSLLIEEEFNARKTWTEYVNRLFGFLAGNGVLLIFLNTLYLKFFKRKTAEEGINLDDNTPKKDNKLLSKLVTLSVVNLVVLAFQAWFGSIVVATNLVPWTITVHLFLALLILGIQLYIIRLISPSQQNNIHTTKAFYSLIIGILIIAFFQMFLGTQVREEIDILRKSGIVRSEWSNNFSISFFVHRSFSWAVLVLITLMFWIKRNEKKYRLIHLIFFLLIMELFSGILLAHFNMPGLVQTAHLFFACIIFGMLTMATFRLKYRID